MAPPSSTDVQKGNDVTVSEHGVALSMGGHVLLEINNDGVIYSPTYGDITDDFLMIGKLMKVYAEWLKEQAMMK